MGLADILEMALTIRAAETTLLRLFSEGQIAGTIHTCLGQEFCAAALAPHLDIRRDAFFATHRGHGHYLALGGPLDALVAELTGRQGALCRGQGGSQHLCFERFFSNGVQGSPAPLALGYAWALQRHDDLRGADGYGVAVAQLGDGSLGQGVVYEAFNIATLLQLPVLFLVEDNGIAMTTERQTVFRGDLRKRVEGFGLSFRQSNSNDAETLTDHLGETVADVRRGRPTVQLIETQRLGPHSKGDDTRPAAVLQEIHRRDALNRLVASDTSLTALAEEVARRVEGEAAAVLTRPLLEPSSMGALPPTDDNRPLPNLYGEEPGDGAAPFVVERLNAALYKVVADDSRVVVVGEDIADPYGGAFKVTRSLSSSFGDRVFSTPISEAAIVGLSNGAALAGMRPIAEIMFCDFATLACDQLVNHGAKFYYSYGGQVRCPVTVRIVSGGGRGYGPTHSQSLERLFCGVPGLQVVALSHRHRPDRLMEAVVADDSPTVLVEHKTVYRTRVPQTPPLDLTPEPSEGTDSFPPLRYRPSAGDQADVTVVTYGGGALVLEKAMEQLIIEQELLFDYFIYTRLWPLDVAELVESLEGTGKLFVLEEGHQTYGFGPALVSACSDACARPLRTATHGADPVPLPCAHHLEQLVLPSVHQVASAIAALHAGHSRNR